MFGFRKNKGKDKKQAQPPAEPDKTDIVAEPVERQEQPAEQAPDTPSAPMEPEQLPADQKRGFFTRLTQGLKRTRTNITEGVATLMLGKKAIDEEVLEEIEMQLLTADVGVDATRAIVDDLTGRVARKQLADAEALFGALREDMVKLLAPVSVPLQIAQEHRPYVILMVGINGAGKTTTIGKLAKRLQNQGHSVMLAAGDTFRAAAVEQLQEWGRRNDIPVIAQQSGADSASVIFDAVQAAQARKIDVLIADTAGRLHTQSNLMEELKKVRRVMGKLDETAPHEVMLVLDAGIGQNAIAQAKQFREAVHVSGITLTKLDGTAKGGVIFAIAKQLGLPIRFIGIGESIDDLREFEAEDFVDALLVRENTNSSQGTTS
ncbi:signal recognition particle-docking protein FtsY [Kaarinaea lacus]